MNDTGVASEFDIPGLECLPALQGQVTMTICTVQYYTLETLYISAKNYSVQYPYFNFLIFFSVCEKVTRPLDAFGLCKLFFQNEKSIFVGGCLVRNQKAFYINSAMLQRMCIQHAEN